MTIVCCWLDESYSRKRVTAIADARAAIQDKDGQWTPLNEETTKLWRVSIACYQMSAFDPFRGVWAAPYYATEIGIGFAGYCFEAMSIVALYQRCLGQLVVDGDGVPRPGPQKLVELLEEITSRWFRGHSVPRSQSVEFLLFGFSPTDGAPWASKVVHRNGCRASQTEFECPILSQSVFSIGDVGQKTEFRSAVQDIRRRIQKHATKSGTRKIQEDPFLERLEAARHIVAEKKSVEQIVLDEMEAEFQRTVGGVLQKAEVIADDDQRGTVIFSRNDQRHILDGLPELGRRLFYVPLAERMGWP